MKLPTLLLIIDRDGTLILNDDFPGREKNWPESVVLNKPVVELISYLKEKFDTTSIVVSNQAGIAHGYFNIGTVQSINMYIDKELKKQGLNIDSWQFCPHVDEHYKRKYPTVNFVTEFLSEKTKRKPSPDMVFDGLKELKKDIVDFDEIIVLGNNKVDSDLADNLNSMFINVTNKTRDQLISEISNTN